MLSLLVPRDSRLRVRAMNDSPGPVRTCHSARDIALNGTSATEAPHRTTSDSRSLTIARLFLRSDVFPSSKTTACHEPRLGKIVSPANRYVFPWGDLKRKQVLPGVWCGVVIISMS